MITFKQFINEGRLQDEIHHNPSMGTLKALARNNKYSTARFVIYKDGSHVAGDSEKYTHHDIAPAMGAWHARGLVVHHEGNYHYICHEPYSALKRDHPLLRTMEKAGIKDGQPLNEVKLIDAGTDKYVVHKDDDFRPREMFGKRDSEWFPKRRWNKIGSTETHDIYHKGNKAAYSKHEYVAHNRATGEVDVHVDGTHYPHKKYGNSTFRVNNASRFHGATMKPHELYSHLIKNHNVILQSSDTQTKGGMNVWKKLKQDPDIHIHGFDDIAQTASHIDKIGRGTTHATSADVERANQLHHGDDWKMAKRIYSLKRGQSFKTMVAHKKED